MFTNTVHNLEFVKDSIHPNYPASQMTSDRNLGHWALSLTKLTLFIEPLKPWKFHKPGLQLTWDTFQIEYELEMLLLRPV